MTLDTTNINSKETLKNVVQQMATVFGNAWSTHSKMRQITKHFKE